MKNKPKLEAGGIKTEVDEGKPSPQSSKRKIEGKTQGLASSDPTAHLTVQKGHLWRLLVHNTFHIVSIIVINDIIGEKAEYHMPQEGPSQNTKL